MDTLKSKTITLVWSHDLDAYIEQHLGRPWRVQQEGLRGQDTLVTFEVSPNPEATAQVQKWLASPVPKYQTWGRDEDITTQTLLDELCNQGLLPDEDLHVHIWW